MVKNVRRGDTVITSGGLVGKVTKVVDDEQIEVEIADGVRVRQMRSMVSEVRAKGEPVKDEGARADRVASGARTGSVPMLYISRWKATAILLTTFLVCSLRGSEFLPREHGAALAEMGAAPHRARPRSAGRLAHSAGGRLQRGAQGKARTLARRRPPHGAREPARQPGPAVIRGNTVEVPRLAKASILRWHCPSCANCRSRSADLWAPPASARSDIVDAGSGLVRLTLTEPAIVERIRQAVEQSIQIVERRVNELGTVEPSIQRQGVDRILVQVPGLQDPTRLKELLGKTAKLTFRMVDSQRAGRSGAARSGAARCRGAQGRQVRGQPAVCDRKAGGRVRRGPDRRPARLRPAQRRADRHLPLQHQGRAPLRPGRRRRMSAGRLPSCSTTR